jgi:hypothetical protein
LQFYLKSDANPLPLQEHNNTEFSKSSIKSQPRKIIEDNEDSEYATAEPDEDLYSLVGDGDQDDMYDNTWSFGVSSYGSSPPSSKANDLCNFICANRETLATTGSELNNLRK